MPSKIVEKSERSEHSEGKGRLFSSGSLNGVLRVARVVPFQSSVDFSRQDGPDYKDGINELALS